MDFTPGALIEARDFADNWFPSKIVEVDAEGGEVLVHFQNWSSRYDEWISMDSARLRPQSGHSEGKGQQLKVARGKDFKEGEKVMALWHNNKRYPAKIIKGLEPGIFEVIFYDGVIMPVKAKHMTRIPKEQADTMEIPFPPPAEGEQLLPMADEIGSKEERRKRKKKIEVADLFRYYKKRPSTESSPTPPVTGPIAKGDRKDRESIDGSLPKTPSEEPVQPPSSSESTTAAPLDPDVAGPSGITKKKKKKKKKKQEVKPESKPEPEEPLKPPPQLPQQQPEKSTEKSKLIKDHSDIFKLKDDKLPAGWEKRAKLKTVGTKAGKWDVIIIGPQGRTFRSKQDIKQYLFVHQLDHDLDLFDFRLGPDFYTSRGMPIPKRALNPISRSSCSPLVKKEETPIAPTPPAVVPPSPAAPVAGSSSPPPLNIEASIPSKAPVIKSEPLAAPPETLEVQTIVPEEASGGFRCPLEDCRKLFRRDNLLVMHIKHYHPALLKKLGCKTVRVEDLAAARTAFETDDAVPVPKQAPPQTPPTVSSSSSILASILSVAPLPTTPEKPPTPQQQQQQLPSPPLRPRSERRVSEPKWLTSSTAPEEDLPLAKRVSLNNQTSSSASTSSTRPGRRRSDKRAPPSQPSEFLHPDDVVLLTPKQEPPPSDSDEVKNPIEEQVIISTLDDIPGQKELVHCFCGSPEEDGLMIQCELCLCWQHGVCLAIDTEENVPDPYVCHFCRYPFKERHSRRYTHDQSWLKKGQLPSLKFISGSSSVPADRTLRVAHTLTAAATDLKQLLNSLKVKIDIAKNKDHPKLYLWAQPWNKKSEIEVSPVPEVAPNPEEDKIFVPNIPLPEAPIDSTDCRLNLLMHITDTQQEVDARLETLEGLFEECDTEEGPMDTSQMAKMLQILLKDVVTLKKMASFSMAG